MSIILQQPPPLPLQNDLENLVFTHKSLFGKPASMVDDFEDPQDWERVAFLGEGILLAAMSRVLYYAYPRRRTSALKPQRTQLLSKESLASITDVYRFMEKLKCLEPSRQNIARSLDNRAALAESFVGGLALQYGMDRARKWAEEMLAWKHSLPVPISDEERLGLEGNPMHSDGKEVVMKDGGGGWTMSMPAMVAPLPPPTLRPTIVSPPPPPSAPSFVQPVTQTIAPRPEYSQIKPPQELPKPVGMDIEIPVQQPMYNPGMYQTGPVRPEVIVAAPMVGTTTTPMTYNASAFYPHSSFKSLSQPDSYMHTPSSPPTVASVPQLPQKTEYKNFKPDNDQPNFFNSINVPSSPPPPSQPVFQSPTKHIPTWAPQTPGASSLSYGAPTSGGLKAVPNKEKGGPPSPAKPSTVTYTPPAQPVLTGFGTVAKLNEHAQKRCQRLQWNFSSLGQGQYISWTAQLFVRGDLVAEGRGQSKQIAKELAAQNALETLGWK
ncbi:hypothetical protein FRC04_010456 [Tulasnella sp. 424]|nr:hypothetical protein FRC04_010456 [Tulasnella sp. 424]